MNILNKLELIHKRTYTNLKNRLEKPETKEEAIRDIIDMKEKGIKNLGDLKKIRIEEQKLFREAKETYINRKLKNEDFKQRKEQGLLKKSGRKTNEEREKKEKEIIRL
jgi:hypothetical protein